MTDHRQTTVDTYNKSAQALAEYFKGIGPRVHDIEAAINLARNPKNPRILEIGCGDGRDAKEIKKRAGWYLGFDISKELIKIARKHVPEAKFVVADANTFQYPDDINIIFAFASLLHLNKDELKQTLVRVHNVLKPGGIFYISLKFAPNYEEKIKKDQYGTRLFYFYNTNIITELAGQQYEVAQKTDGFVVHGNTKWFEIALRKK